jgi:hypothetical protein
MEDNDQKEPPQPEQPPKKKRASKKFDINFRFLKLMNGEDIICQVPAGHETEHSLIIAYPVKVMSFFDPHEDDAMYVMMPWIPFSSSELIPISKLVMSSFSRFRYIIFIVSFTGVIATTREQQGKAPTKPLKQVPEQQVDEDAEVLPPMKVWVN